MATIVAAVGGGNWTAGATWVGNVAPTAADDAVLDVNSGAVTIDSGAVARSLDCSTYANVLTHAAGVTLTLGDGTAGAGNVALKLVAGMTYTLGSATTSTITFASTSATQQTITTGGKSIGGFTINGAGSSYQLADTMTSTGSAVTLIAGTLNTNSQTCTWFGFVTSGATTRTLTMGSSAITITQNGALGWEQPGSCTMTANTATITFTGGTGVFDVYGKNMNGTSIVFTGGSVQLLNGCTVANVTITGTAIKTNTVFTSGDVTVTGTLTITGNSAINRMLVFSNAAGTVRTYSAATVSLTNVDFQDVTAAGAAIPFTGTSLGNCGGNTNITFTTPATQTHTASAGGNWSDVTKWTSRVPLPQDDVVIDVNTTGTITTDMPRLGKSIDFSGFGGTASFTSTPNTLYGSLTLGAGMTATGTNTLTLSGRGTQTITSNGVTFSQSIIVIAPGGSYTLVDTLTSTGSIVVGNSISTTLSGVLNTAGFTVTCGVLNVSGLNAQIITNNSTFNLTSTATANILLSFNGGVFIAGTSVFNIVNASANTRGISFTSSMSSTTINYTVAGSTGTLNVGLGFSTTYGTLNFSDASNARTIRFFSGTTATFAGIFNVQGGPGRIVTIDSSTPGSAATIAKTSGVVSADYLSIKDSTATGGASWYAGVNSTNVSNNTGWFFQAYSSSKFLELM